MIEVQADSPERKEVAPILERHLTFCRAVTPPEHLFALDLSGLKEPGITFCTARHDGSVVGMGAIRRLDGGSAEVKSMHVVSEARGLGAGRAVLEWLLERAKAWDCATVFLETGTMPEFAPARRLYTDFGFNECGPFGDYVVSPSNLFMRLDLSRSREPIGP